MPIDYDQYEGYGETPERRGGGGKRPHKIAQKSGDAVSAEEKENLRRKSQENAEEYITKYIDETWRSFDGEDRTKRIASYVKWMDNAARQKTINLDPKEVRIKNRSSNNAREPAITSMHIPTRLTANAEDENGQIKALVDLRDTVRHHVDIWKETSPEFRKKWLKLKESEKQEEKLFTPLPEGVSIDELRDQIPASQELIIKFNWEGDADGKPKIAQVGEKEKYPIYPNLEYRVNPNPDKTGWVFMNPVDPKGPAPEDSDIPVKLDRYFASEKGRKASGITISAKNTSERIKDGIKNVAATKEDSGNGAYDEFRKFVNEYTQTEGAKTIEMLEELLDLKHFEKGDRANQMIFHQVYILMENQFFRTEDASKINLKELAEDSFLSYMTHLKEITDKRPGELKQLGLDPDSMAIAFDNIPIDPNTPDEGLIVLTTYIPNRGWTVTIPAGNCPNAAAFMIRRFAAGKLEDENNLTFKSSTKEAVEQGLLRFSNDGKILIFNKVSMLDPGMAVFHNGSYTIKQAMETLRVSGDPRMGEQVFGFAVYKDDSELVTTQGEHITLEFD